MAYTTFTYTLTLTAATGNQDGPRPYVGRLLAVGFKFSGVPGTTVLTLTTKGSEGPVQTLLVTPAGNTDTWYYPLKNSVLNTSGASIATWWSEQIVDDYVNLAAASSGAGAVQVFMAIQDS